MSESNDTRPLPERGQHHFEWVPDEPLERAIAQAETVYGQRGQATIVMILLRNLIAAIRGLLERIRPKEVPDGNPEYL